MENMIPTVAAAAVGMAIGGAAVYAATQCTDFPAGQKKL